MVLTKDDLDKIRKVVKSEIDLGILKLEKRIDRLEIDNQHFKKEFKKLHEKLDQIKSMETEDVQAIADDVEMLKKQVTKLEAKTI